MLIRSVHRNGVSIGDGLSDKAAATMLVRSARAAELPTDRLSGHSPRRGLATDLAEAGAARNDIEKAGGWATGSSVVTDYLDEADLWASNPLVLLSGS